MGGATPSSGWEGFLSGLAHPVLGLDHLAFLVAVGLMGALCRSGIFVPLSFVAASLAGTSVHLLGLDAPAPEWTIAATVVFIGALLFLRARSLTMVLPFVSAAGFLHGYAYGESIVGAETTPLSTYLMGLALVQLALAVSIPRLLQAEVRWIPALRWAGAVIGGAGLMLLGAQWLG
jgi:urease accessory protein